jgi:hypothetical protein
MTRCAAVQGEDQRQVGADGKIRGFEQQITKGFFLFGTDEGSFLPGRCLGQMPNPLHRLRLICFRLAFQRFDNDCADFFGRRGT